MGSERIQRQLDRILDEVRKRAPRPLASDADLPIAYHGFTIKTPHFPGYQNVWDNPAMSRWTRHTWGGQGFISFMLMRGCWTAAQT